MGGEWMASCVFELCVVESETFTIVSHRMYFFISFRESTSPRIVSRLFTIINSNVKLLLTLIHEYMVPDKMGRAAVRIHLLIEMTLADRPCAMGV